LQVHGNVAIDRARERGAAVDHRVLAEQDDLARGAATGG
jgi:hypothetical protein